MLDLSRTHSGLQVTEVGQPVMLQNADVSSEQYAMRFRTLQSSDSL